MNNKKITKTMMKRPSTRTTRTTITSTTIIAIVASAAMILGVLEPNFAVRTSTNLWQ
ncbi:MAG TPA: hypothetical protein VE593_10590 [Nitrososphaeraceae archaeon]|nr:hypothetical protein [Nitrososphaeraceae archaeon]